MKYGDAQKNNLYIHGILSNMPRANRRLRAEQLDSKGFHKIRKRNSIRYGLRARLYSN